MKRFLLATALGAVALSTVPAFADQFPGQKLATIHGQCTDIVIQGQRQVPQWCDRKLINLILDNGREGFVFVIHKPTAPEFAIAFFGSGSREIHQDKDHVILPVDQIDMSFNGKVDDVRASGQCTFANPTQGRPVPVFCSVTTADGYYSGSFMSDGSYPVFSGSR